LDESWSAVGIAADGRWVPLGRDASTPVPDSDDAFVRAVAARIARGEDSGHRFLWASDDGPGWLQVALHRCCLDAARHGTCYGTVLAMREVDAPRGLTKREIEVLSAVVAGDSNAAIGEKLHVTPRTVKAHVEHILEKLDVPTRAAAAVCAVEEGLVLLPAAKP
jgi:DNA-binding NarL/FixJ family response regulator